MSEETVGELCEESARNGPIRRGNWVITHICDIDVSDWNLSGLYVPPGEGGQ